METSNRSNIELMKPVLKAGIPLAIALGGFIFARVLQKRIHQPNCCEIHENIVVLRSRLEDIENQENQLETRFEVYQQLNKDQQVSLAELQNRVEFIANEITSFAEVFKRIEIEVMEVSGLLKSSTSIKEKLYKLLRSRNRRYRLLWKRSLRIQAKELEVMQSRDAEVKDGLIRKMADEIKELKQITLDMQIGKNQLLNNLTVEGKNSTTQTPAEKEGVALENYNAFGSEIVLEAEEEEEINNELMYLRRCNAFLRHEQMKRSQVTQVQEEQLPEEENEHLSINFGRIADIQEFGSGNEVGGVATNSQVQVHVHSKRQRLMTKFRKWVEGTEKTKQHLEENEHANKYCFRRHSVSDGPKLLLSARKSCSSA